MDSEVVSGETGNRKQEPAAQEMWDQVPRSQKALATGATNRQKKRLERGPEEEAGLGRGWKVGNKYLERGVLPTGSFREQGTGI
jgi:hypothetical protein